MKGDFSRLTFDSGKRYRRVLEQQGRVRLDSDWNEQTEIVAHRDRLAALDVIGPCGAPKAGGGFCVSCGEDGDLGISAGRLYVAGTLCELDADTTYLRQPDLPRPPPISPADGRTDLVYLDVWDRHITSIEDPDIREPALGGPDTATRVKVVWQVRVLAGVSADDPIPGWPPEGGGGCAEATIAGKTPENRLYRVEIHQGGPMGTATFKWSRDNGSVVFAVSELGGVVSGRTRAVVEPTAGERPDVGNWMEVIGDESELGAGHGTLARVAELEDGGRVVWLDGDLSAHSEEAHPKLRSWDQHGEALVVTDAGIELEPGAEIRFSAGPFNTGDYWAFPARPGQEPVDWPPAPPRGIRHDYCRLALVTWRRDGESAWSSEVTDCRRIFEPLSADGCGSCREELAELREMLEHQARELRDLRARPRT